MSLKSDLETIAKMETGAHRFGVERTSETWFELETQALPDPTWSSMGRSIGRCYDDDTLAGIRKKFAESNKMKVLSWRIVCKTVTTEVIE